MRITLRHESGVTKRVKIGFSWTFFFFSIWVPLFRGDFKNLFRIWGLSIITFGIYSIVSCWTYNRIYTQDLLVKGYAPIDESSREILIAKGLISKIAA